MIQLATNRTSLLATAIIRICDDEINKNEVRALLDSGSQANLISKQCAKMLKLKIEKCNTQIAGVGDNIGNRVHGVVNVNIIARFESDFNLNIDALVIDCITEKLPVQYIDNTEWHGVSKLLLADPQPQMPGRIDVLLGVDVWGQIVKPKCRPSNANEPHAQETSLGWILFGPVSGENINIANTGAVVDLESTLEKFWAQEEIYDRPLMSEEELACENLFERTFQRQSNGRFIVQIPFKADAGILGNSRNMAYRQFLHLERRLIGDEILKKKYVDFMREYVDLKHMEEVTPLNKHESQGYYIPHHPVHVDDKFRVVFNASAKTTTVVSLNDTQMIGPALQDSLAEIILHFRRFQVAITGDVAKMYRQVLIHPKQRDWQRILWRENTNEPLREFQLMTVTYGTTSGAYNAIKALQMCAKEFMAVASDMVSLGSRGVQIKESGMWRFGGGSNRIGQNGEHHPSHWPNGNEEMEFESGISNEDIPFRALCARIKIVVGRRRNHRIRITLGSRYRSIII